MKKTEFRVMIPIDLTPLETIFPTHRQQDKARAFFQLMFLTRVKMKTNRKFYPNIDRSTGYCPISSVKLQKLLRDYRPIVNKLKEYGLIEIDENDCGTEKYHTGAFPKLYRPKFSEGITSAEQQRYRVELITHPDVMEAIQRVYLEQGYDVKKKVFLESTPWYSNNLEFMEGLFINLTDEELWRLHPEEFHYLRGVIHKFNDGLAKYVSRDLKYSGRINSWVSNLNKELNPFLSHRDGGQLISIDISSSQPFFLASLFIYPNTLLKLVPAFKPIAEKIIAGRTHSQVRKFHLDCCLGNLYPTLELATGLDRDKVKEQLFHHVLYCPPGNHLKGDEALERIRFRNGFNSVYGKIYDKLLLLKRTRKGTLPFIAQGGWKQYNIPNMICARLEVVIAIDLITKSCVSIGIPTATRHDEWVLRKEDEEKFIKVFLGVFEELGIEPPMYKRRELGRTT